MTPNEVLKETGKMMEASIHAVQHEVAKIRTGRANIALLDGIHVEAYGTQSPLNQVANLTVPEPRMIVIQPYDRSIIKAIDTAINKSDLGLTPNNDGTVIRLHLPELTGERREELVKITKKIGEEGKVALRNHRHKAIDAFKEAEKDGDIPQDESKRLQGEIQKMTDNYTTKIDEILKEKEDEILHF
ncbi:MAG: ribosome recycling factor [Candidatus Omnitrophica bacterium]|nr:ribosome recycling factor [Candidatus Omnitrophota bacterium]